MRKESLFYAGNIFFELWSMKVKHLFLHTEKTNSKNSYDKYTKNILIMQTPLHPKCTSNKFFLYLHYQTNFYYGFNNRRKLLSYNKKRR